MTKKKRHRRRGGQNTLTRTTKDLADRIIAQIKAGTAPWQKPWKPGQQVLPESLATKLHDRNKS